MLHSTWEGKPLVECADPELAAAAAPLVDSGWFENDSGLPDALALGIFEAIAARILQRRHQ